MRPRKRILLYSSDADQLHQIGFPLDLRGLSVLATTDRAIALDLARHENIYCAVLLRTYGKDGCQKLADDLDKLRVSRRLDFKVLLLNYCGESTKLIPAHHVLSGPDLTPATIFECIRCYAARKRGPKKASRPLVYETATVRILEKESRSA